MTRFGAIIAAVEDSFPSRDASKGDRVDAQKVKIVILGVLSVAAIALWVMRLIG
ncbi:MAG: hypothetical protein HY671_01450 [Chloroflexi bacterium]|nr:hypothetical protein [Chloroflexota bacterium]